MVDWRDPRWLLLRSKNGCCPYSKWLLPLFKMAAALTQNGCCEVISGRIPKQQNLLKIGAALLAVDTWLVNCLGEKEGHVTSLSVRHVTSHHYKSSNDRTVWEELMMAESEWFCLDLYVGPVIRGTPRTGYHGPVSYCCLVFTPRAYKPVI